MNESGPATMSELLRSKWLKTKRSNPLVVRHGAGSSLWDGKFIGMYLIHGAVILILEIGMHLLVVQAEAKGAIEVQSLQNSCEIS